MKFIKLIIAASAIFITTASNAQFSSKAESDLFVSLAACGAAAAVLPDEQQLQYNSKCHIPVIMEYTSSMDTKIELYKSMISLSNTLLGKMCANNNSSECTAYRKTLRPTIIRFVE